MRGKNPLQSQLQHLSFRLRSFAVRRLRAAVSSVLVALRLVAFFLTITLSLMSLVVARQAKTYSQRVILAMGYFELGPLLRLVGRPLWIAPHPVRREDVEHSSEKNPCLLMVDRKHFLPPSGLPPFYTLGNRILYWPVCQSGGSSIFLRQSDEGAFRGRNCHF